MTKDIPQMRCWTRSRYLGADQLGCLIILRDGGTFERPRKYDSGSFHYSRLQSAYSARAAGASRVRKSCLAKLRTKRDIGPAE